jgi:integrase
VHLKVQSGQNKEAIRYFNFQNSLTCWRGRTAPDIRASECAGLTEQDINWQEQTIHVVGKGGHERTVPLNEEVVHILKQYRIARGQRINFCFKASTIDGV